MNVKLLLIILIASVRVKERTMKEEKELEKEEAKNQAIRNQKLEEDTYFRNTNKDEAKEKENVKWNFKILV